MVRDHPRFARISALILLLAIVLSLSFIIPRYFSRPYSDEEACQIGLAAERMDLKSRHKTREEVFAELEMDHNALGEGEPEFCMDRRSWRTWRLSENCSLRLVEEDAGSMFMGDGPRDWVESIEIFHKDGRTWQSLGNAP